MSNNLQGPRVAPGQDQKEQTINDSIGAIDGAVSGVHMGDYADEETLTIPAFYHSLVLSLGDGMTLGGAWTLYTPAPAPRGLFVVRNGSGQAVTVGIEDQPETMPVVADGATALLLHDGENVTAL